MKTSEILKEARALIDTPDKWGKAAYPWVPREQRMNRRGLGSPDRCHCMATALHATAYKHGFRMSAFEVDTAFDVLSSVVPGHVITEFNDSIYTTHADALRAYDAAIAEAERVEAEG